LEEPQVESNSWTSNGHTILLNDPGNLMIKLQNAQNRKHSIESLYAGWKRDLCSLRVHELEFVAQESITFVENIIARQSKTLIKSGWSVACSELELLELHVEREARLRGNQ
jgi:hypothetical protein